jgi:hypothetical protein
MRDLGRFDITPYDEPPAYQWTRAGVAAAVFAGVEWLAAIAYWSWRLLHR